MDLKETFCYDAVEKRTLHWTPARVLVTGFLFIISIGTLLLKLPISLMEGHSISFVDALFTATSAVCVTGLVVVDVGTTFSPLRAGSHYFPRQIGASASCQWHYYSI